MKNNRKLKNFILSRRQLQHVLLLTLSACALYTIAALLWSTSLLNYMGYLNGEYQVPVQYQQQMIAVIHRAIIPAVFVGVLVTFLVAVLITLITHRFYGPVVQIRQFTKKISEGDYSARLKLRHSDELQDLAVDLNEMAVNLEGRHKG